MLTQKKYDAKDIYECPVCIVESEIHMVQALEDIKKQDVMHFAYILETSDRRFRDTSCKTFRRTEDVHRSKERGNTG